ncbi:FUSC family protein [Microbacterium sp. NPDC055910]|uniref:FUSC family protein n=1 Tax=Microbacterium sp. NPDC055910 TaxID=3345659 RepID=UPI0035D57175
MRVRRHGGSVIAAAVAAALAYALASALFGTENAFFAPIAAVICVGLSGGQRVQRSLEVLGGVLVGVIAGELVALLDLPVAVLLGVTVAVAMGAAVAVRATALFTNQAAVAAVVTLVLTPIAQAPPFLRIADALVGGAVALLIAVVAAFRGDRLLVSTVSAATDELADTLERVSAGLSRPGADLDALVAEVFKATGAVAELDDAVRASRESVRLGRRGRKSAHLRVRAVRVRDEWFALTSALVSLARAARAVHRNDEDATDAAIRVAALARVVRGVGQWATAAADPQATLALRSELRDVGRAITAQLRDDTTTAVRVLLVSARSALVDLMRMTGMTHRESVAVASGRDGRRDDPAT